MKSSQELFAFAPFHFVTRCANTTARALASIRVAIVLIVLFTIALVSGMILDARHGREFSQWYVYQAGWYIGLLGLLAGSVFSAAYVRFPWKLRQTGFVITHIGLLVLIGGMILSYFLGIDGQVVLVDGQTTDELTLTERSQLTACWADRPNERPYVFSFASGPTDWKPGKCLDMGSVDGLGVCVLSYYQQSEPVQNWVPDITGRAGPLVRFEMDGPISAHAATPAQKQKPVVGLLVDQDYGAEVLLGPIAIRLQRATSAAMLADFLQPRDKNLGEKGVLTAYYNESVECVPVDGHVGKKMKIGKTDAEVELVQYLPNGKLDGSGQFQPVGTEARNPLVELKVELAGDEQPYRQVAFAKSPLLNFDGIYARQCPVKFAYEHPKFDAADAVEFLQANDGRLYARTVQGGKSTVHGEVTKSSRLPLDGGSTFTIKEYMAHAKCDLSFSPSSGNPIRDPLRDASAAKFVVAMDGVQRTFWLQRNSPEFQFGTIDLPQGALRAQFTADRLPLGFEVKLVDFHHEKDDEGGERFWSNIEIAESNNIGTAQKQLVTINQPACYNGYWIFQTSYCEAGHGEEASILRVCYDPGRPFKYLGNCVICLGIAVMIARRCVKRSRPS